MAARLMTCLPCTCLSDPCHGRDAGTSVSRCSSRINFCSHSAPWAASLRTPVGFCHHLSHLMCSTTLPDYCCQHPGGPLYSLVMTASRNWRDTPRHRGVPGTAFLH